MRRVTTWLLALAAGCTAASARPETQPSPGTSAFVDVNVVPMTAAATLLRNHTVLVRENRIVALGPVDEVVVPHGARQIEGAGRYLIPGLADMHVHLEYFEEPTVLTLFLANGVTTVRNMDGRGYILGWRQAVAEGRLLGPAIRTAGPILDGDPPILPDNTIIRTAAEARARVEEQASAGYDFVKIYTNLEPAAYRAVLRAARDRGLPVAGHVPRRVDLAEALEGGQVSIEHLGDYSDWIEADDSPFRSAWHWSKLYLGMPVDTTMLHIAARRIAASHVWTVPTLVQAERALAPPDTIRAWLSRPEMVHVPADGRAFWEEQSGRSAERMAAGDWTLVLEGQRNRRALVRTLHAAGADLLIGTDTPNPFVVPGVSVLDELDSFVRAGIPAGEALVIATREAARFLGELDEWGTIEPGKRADLVLLEGNPLEDIRNVARRAGVMAGGRWLPEAELQGLLAGLRLR